MNLWAWRELCIDLDSLISKLLRYDYPKISNNDIKTGNLASCCNRAAVVVGVWGLQAWWIVMVSIAKYESWGLTSRVWTFVVGLYIAFDSLTLKYNNELQFKCDII